MTARRASTLAVASVVAIALLVVLLATWASSIGPSDVLRGTGHSASATATTSEPTASPSSSEGSLSALPEERSEAAPWVRALARILNVVAVVVIGLLLLRLAYVGVRRLRLRRERRRRVSALDEVDFDAVAAPVRVAREMLADAAEQRQVLLDGSPRNAVVACWDRFESQGEAAGLGRRAWETSSEYTIRVLDLVDAHEPAVARLAALYREARFSEHELTEADRREAVEALDAIHRALGVRP